MSARAYGRLMAGGGGDPFDRHLFACVATVALSEPRPLAVALGLSAEGLAALVGEFFPHAPEMLAGLNPEADGTEPMTADESALRSLLLRHRSAGFIEEGWLAHILARRSLSDRPLWQDMGLGDRTDLSLALARHFKGLADRNGGNMRWKPFFWREIELGAGWDCRAATKCRHCRQYARCFGPEPGHSLILATQ